MSESDTIILGVVSGIITTALIYLCVSIFNRILIPWYRAAIYGGIDINGAWTEEVQHEGAIDTIRYDLVQKERNVTGTMNVVKQHRHNDEITTKILILTGNFVDGHLILTGTNVNQKEQSLTTFLLRVTRAGSSLRGQSSWVDSNAGHIISREAEFLRAGT